MINGGNATVYVSNMDNAIRFYTEVLGLKLTNRFGDHWATVQAGKTLVIGLHPWSAKFPSPGTKGSVQIGLVVSQDVRIEEHVTHRRCAHARMRPAVGRARGGDASAGPPANAETLLRPRAQRARISRVHQR